jgi:ABC-type phosphate/phosphonate transport system substrate-binding protein
MHNQDDAWECRGIQHDGTKSPLAHEDKPEIVTEDRCPICNLHKTQVKGKANNGFMALSQKGKYVLISIGGISLLAFAGFTLKGCSKPPIKNPIVLGILTDPNCNPPEKYTEFISYLENAIEEEVGRPVEIEQDFIPLRNLPEGKDRLRSQTWDIAFTTSPVLAVEARNSNYHYAFRMFPEMPHFQSALFVRQDSPINSLDDITPQTTIALGTPNNVPAFRIPLYELFGLSFSADRDNSLQEIIEKVLMGQADVGTGIYSVLAQETDRIRIISQSRALPLSGVYLSPQLSEEEKEIIQTVMTEASPKIQEDAHYADDYAEPDYFYFEGIEDRAIELENCVDWSNPINMWESCTGNIAIRNEPIPGAIAGEINGFELRDQDIYLRMQGNDGEIYRIILPITIMEADAGIPYVEKLLNSPVQVTPDVSKNGAGAFTELKITKTGQLQILGE